MAGTLPMESNPETMNSYLQKLGVPNKWRMVDVIGLEGDALKWVPRPVLAVILLFPLSEHYEQHRIQQESELLKNHHQVPKDVFYLKQILSNICGTIALVHSVANNTHYIELENGLLKSYINEAKDLDASGKGALLEKSSNILEAYKETIETADQAMSAENETLNNNHFVTFIHKEGNLYELDGRKCSPVNHGPTTAEDLLENAAKICRDFIAREPHHIGFNVVALVPV